MADTAVSITQGSGTSIDTRTESTNGNHRQVIVIGDPATNAGVAPVDATAGLKVDLGADNDVAASGSVAHDSADSGNPVKIGAKAESAISTATMVADGDRTDAYADIDGVLLVRNSRPLGDLISERVSNTDGSSTAFTNFGATASTRNVITGYSIYNDSATAGYVDFRDGTSGSVLWTVPIPTKGGANFAIPDGIFRTSANTALAYDVSAALTTVYISVTGFKSKV